MEEKEYGKGMKVVRYIRTIDRKGEREKKNREICNKMVKEWQ